MAERTAALLAVGALAFAACSRDEPPPTTSCSSPTPASAGGARPSLPPGFPIDRWGVVTLVEERGGYAGAVALSDRTVDELYPLMIEDLEAAGFDHLGGENEGFEAEISFASAQRNGTIALREADCDRVRIQVLLARR